MVQVPQALIQKSTKRFTTSYWLYVVRVEQLLTSQKPPRPMDGKQADIFLNDTKGFQNKEREKSLKTLVETIRHTNGTNMTVISTNSKEFVE
jgi:hypothetical protein